MATKVDDNIIIMEIEILFLEKEKTTTLWDNID